MPELLEQTSERLVYKAYATGAIDPGVEPALASDPQSSGGQVLRYVSHTLSLQKETYAAEEIRTDQQRPMEKHGTRRVPAAINGLLSPLTYKDLLAACLGGTWSGAGISLSNTQLTSAAADNATSKFTFAAGDPVALGLRVGDVLRFANLSDAGNNGKNFLILAMGGTSNREVTVYPAPVTMSADTSFTVDTVGRSLFMPASGHVKRKFAVEVYTADGDLSRVFTEGRFAGFELSIAPDQMAQINFQSMFRNRQVFDSGNAPFFTSPTAQTTTEVISSMDGLLRMAGATVGIVTGLTINFNRAPSAPAQINAAGLTAGVVLANAVVGGEFTVFLQDKTFLDAFGNATELELIAWLPASNALAASGMLFHLPRIKINSNEEQNIDGAKALRCGFTAARYFGSAPGVESTSIRIVDTDVT